MAIANRYSTPPLTGGHAEEAALVETAEDLDELDDQDEDDEKKRREQAG